MNISLMHLGTRETRSLPVEYVSREMVTVRWGQAGLYDLLLSVNVLRPRDIAARRKTGFTKSLWQASDIQGVRRMVDEHFNGQKQKAAAESMIRHAESMPGARRCMVTKIYGPQQEARCIREPHSDEEHTFIRR